MRFSTRAGLVAGAAVTLTAVVAVPPAVAVGADEGSRAVFVQDDAPTGNTVFAYDRHDDGTLSLAASYSTKGLGGALNGSVVDHLASQGSLTLDRAHRLLFAVNAGSNTVTVFKVHGDHLSLRQVLRSGGSFPVSIAVSGDLVYALNARDGGTVSGYRIDQQDVDPIAHSIRPLGLDPTATPEFTNTPGQVAFTPDGSQLLVTTKANGNDVDVFAVRQDGRLATPTVNALPDTVPFAGAFDRTGHLLLTEAGPNAVASFDIKRSGTLVPLDVLTTGQAATCWITTVREFGYASNAGSASVTGVSTSRDGGLSSIGQTGTDAGTVDSAASSNGRFLYVQAGGAGDVDGYRVNRDGSLTPVGTITIPDGVGGEGIAAS